MTGGQYFAALRMLMHIRGGAELNEGLAYIQGRYPRTILLSSLSSTLLALRPLRPHLFYFYPSRFLDLRC